MADKKERAGTPGAAPTAYDYSSERNAPLYTEVATNIIYEAKNIGAFVVVRPVSRHLVKLIRRIPQEELELDFRPYEGNPQHVRDYLAGTVTVI